MQLALNHLQDSVRSHSLGWLLANNDLTQRQFVALVAQIDASITDMGKLHLLP
jgi:hypothetical protein